MSSRLSLVALFGTVFISATASAATSANEAAILKIEQAMAAAQSAAEATATWDKNVIFDDMILPGETTGKDAVLKELQPQFDAVGHIDTKILRIKIVAESRVAFAFSVQHLVAPGKNGGPGLDAVFRESDGFVKKAGKWTLVTQHISVPFDPKTGKAVFDSK
jgi:ketosteroid isomerase-like protein